MDSMYSLGQCSLKPKRAASGRTVPFVTEPVSRNVLAGLAAAPGLPAANTVGHVNASPTEFCRVPLRQN